MAGCKYVEKRICAFKHEVANEDCLLCLPNSMIIHMTLLLEAICSMSVEFGYARRIYRASDEIHMLQRGFVKLMRKSYPEAFERAKIKMPVIEAKGVV